MNHDPVQLIDALRYVRPLIERGEHRFICNAATAHPFCQELRQYVRDWMSKKYISYELEQYLRDTEGMDYRMLRETPEGTSFMRSYRLNWIDERIAELERCLDND